MNTLALRGHLGPPTDVNTGRLRWLTIALPAALLGWLVTSEWLAGLSVLVLALIWHLLQADEGPPVLALALSFQWLQVTSGLFYYGLTGRAGETVLYSDYRPMVLIGLGCLAALTLGLYLGLRTGPRMRLGNRPAFATAMAPLLMGYAVSTAAIGVIPAVAWRLSSLTQGVLAVGYLRFVLLYLLLRRLSTPRFQWSKIGALLGFELLLGFTGYFASFREPLMFFALVLLERFDRRKLRDWALVGALGAGMFLTGLLWLGIRTTYRADIQLEAVGSSRIERAGRIADLSKSWFGRGGEEVWGNLDYFVHRLWAVYYPALALQRVPSILPHENGRILGAAVKHIFTPRLFFPGKAVLVSDSELVRTYSGIWVAGVESNTSIAFGYAAESYVDFGLPLMFLPILAFGLLMGWLYRLLLRLIWHRELAIGLVTVIFWLSLYLFERSWVKWLGSSITMVIFLGGLVFVLDRLLRGQRNQARGQLGEALRMRQRISTLRQAAVGAGGAGTGEGGLEAALEGPVRGSELPARFPPPPWA